MKCIDPVLCYKGPSGRIFRHWSLANEVFRVAATQVFDCGKCVFCRKKRSRELAVRCVLEASLYTENCFLTLTYDESQDGYHNFLDYSQIQRFKKRLRSRIERKGVCGASRVRIFNVHEYGYNGKKHWHLIVFNYGFPDKVVKRSCDGYNLYTSAELASLWTLGFHTIGDVSLASAMYQAQYAKKEVEYSHGRRAYSKHSGIGKDWFLRNYDQVLRLGYIPFEGLKEPVPRYFAKLAHKHWAHFYAPSFFFDLPDRKRVYSPFKDGEAIKALADLYPFFLFNKQKLLDEKVIEWNNFINDHWLEDRFDFQISGENFLHDLKNKPKRQEF